MQNPYQNTRVLRFWTHAHRRILLVKIGASYSLDIFHCGNCTLSTRLLFHQNKRKTDRSKQETWLDCVN